MNRITVIQALDEEECPYCGDIKELRPYGPNFTKICYKCKDQFPEDDIDARMKYRLFGDPLPKHLEHEVGN